MLASATLGYFGYVVLGAISPKLHEHVFTGDEKDSVMTRLKKGCPVTFSKGRLATPLLAWRNDVPTRNSYPPRPLPADVYAQFYFPAYLRYFKTYSIHTLMAGVWLLTGAYNLQRQPQLAGIKDGKVGICLLLLLRTMPVAISTLTPYPGPIRTLPSRHSQWLRVRRVKLSQGRDGPAHVPL